VLRDNNQWGVAIVEYGMGTLARARGDDKMAVRYFEDAMEIFAELDAWSEIARCQAGIGWIALAGGELDLAHDSLAEGLRLNQLCGQRLGIARGLEAFAALAVARQQPAQAATLAGAACQLRDSLGQLAVIGPKTEQVLEFARARLGVPAADALFAGGREMTVDDAARYALAARPQASGPAAGEPAASAPRPDGGNGHRSLSPLTPREHEIVLLITQGLSNKEIADELVISPATAARHVANILAKLGFTSRTQVASWASRHEPPDGHGLH
jgi:DNA-binding CsgD family transcriptional regulator